MDKIKSVLFICTGNSCRSVMAEWLLKKRLSQLGRSDIVVRSAGIRAANDFPPTNETIEVMNEEGVDLSDFKSKALTKDMIKASDLILVMEHLHKDEVLKIAPEAAQKTYLLTEFGKNNKIESYSERLGVPDPIGRPMKDYKYCLNMIKKEIERIAHIL